MRVPDHYGIYTWDTSNPERPRRIGIDVLNREEAPARCKVANEDYLYAWADCLDLPGFHIFSRDEDGELDLTSVSDFEGHSIVCYENYCYLYNTLGVQVIDVSNPNSPEEIYFFDLPRNYSIPVALFIENGILFASKGKGGFYLFNLDKPTHPDPVGFYDTPGSCTNMDFQGNRVFVADSYSIGVYDFSASLGPWFLTTDPNSLAFDSVGVGESDTLNILLSSSSEITGISFANNIFSCSIDTPIELSLQADTTLYVIFTPPSDRDSIGRMTIHSGDRELHIPLSGRGYTIDNVVSDEQSTPYTFSLSEPYPNPFNSTATISYQVARTSKVNITIYDLSGRIVTTLQQGVQQPGTCAATWDAGGVPSGMYLVQMTAGDFRQVRKAMLLR